MNFRSASAASVLCASVCFGRPQPQPLRPSATPGIIEQTGRLVTMHDGIHLVCDVYLPRANQRWPTVLVRTPYSRRTAGSRAFRNFALRGYAVVVQDVRGRNGSQGVFGMANQEGADGNDTINWIAAQPWSNGRVAMVGASYVAMTQWWAAITANPHLLAISPILSGDDEYLDRFYSPGGAFKLGHRLLWLSQNFTPPGQPHPVLSRYIYHLPLITADWAAGINLPIWTATLEHPSYDEFWRNLSIRERLDRVTAPVLSFGGWFDNYGEGDLDAFSRLAAHGKIVETWIGPWAHNPGLKFSTHDFGPRATITIRPKQTEWFDEWLKPHANTTAQVARSRLHIFVMGPNVWREEHEWPLARTRYEPLYLLSGGRANSRFGDGILAANRSKSASSDTFTYDPARPVPTVGGAICCDPRLLPPGPLDQTPVESRPDVLVYTSEPLRSDLEVTGPVRVQLFVATSANDTDFTAKLVDVQPDGRPLSVTDGILRLRYRLSLVRPVFVKRNQAYEISIDAGVTSYVFGTGHRIRLEISSSNFPRFDRNLNSIGPNAYESTLNKAQQTVLHEPKHPSALILPVIGDSAPLRAHSVFRVVTRAHARLRNGSSSQLNAASAGP